MENEAVQIITNLVSNVGFPIVACIALFWFNVKIIQPLSENIAKFTAILERWEKKFES